MTPQQKRAMLLMYLIKAPPGPGTPEARLVALWKQELAQLQRELSANKKPALE